MSYNKPRQVDDMLTENCNTCQKKISVLGFIEVSDKQKFHACINCNNILVVDG